MKWTCKCHINNINIGIRRGKHMLLLSMTRTSPFKTKSGTGGVNEASEVAVAVGRQLDVAKGPASDISK